MEYVISIAKRYNHARTHYRDPRNRGIKGAKPVLGIYIIDENWNLRFKKISRWMIPYYRTRLWKRRICYCLECGGKSRALVKKDTDNPECPYCSGSMCVSYKSLVKMVVEETNNKKDEQ